MGMSQEIADQIAKAEARGADAYKGMDWCELSDAEAERFGLDRAEFPRLLVVWQAYLAFCDILAAEDASLTTAAVEAERLRLPQYVDGLMVSGETFKALAHEWAGVAPAKAQAMYDKVNAWNEWAAKFDV